MSLNLSLALLVASTALLACGSPPKAKEATPILVDPNLPPDFHLGDASTPQGYQLRLAIDPSVAEFQGTVRIAVELNTPLHTLWLHQKDLHVDTASFQRDGKSVALKTITSDHDAELLGLVSTEELALGPGSIHVEFHGELGSLQGLFRQIEDKRWYAYSDFEATDARAAFPCYDEPRFRVPWRIEVIAPPDSIAFANAPESSREVWDRGSTLFRFEETRPLPSYLVAVAVGPFDYIEGGTTKTPLRIIAPKGQAERGRFVLENTGRWIQYLEKYLGMAMPFPKLDFIAVPVFGGAMENPGLVTFSSSILLTQPSANTQQRRRAAGVTSHELAHMWFGNLVTPADWTDLWLNEAFATWLSDKVVANWEPGRAREVLDIADKSTAYAIDHQLGGRRVRQATTSRQDIRDAFDPITYRKGGSLLTMLEAWLGEETMRTAVRAYLGGPEGKSVKGPDLVKAMREADPKKRADKILRSYLRQAGIPEVEVTVRCGDAATVELVQSRYIPIAEQARAGAEERAQQWTMPVCLRYPSQNGLVRECLLLDQARVTRRLQTKSCPRWLLPNDRESGYYHYRLDEAGFAALATAKLDKREQLGLVHNLVAGLKAGNLSVAFALDALEAFAPTGSIAVQQAVIPLLYELERSVVGTAERARFSARIRRWYQARLAGLGLESRRGEPSHDQQLRPVLIHLLVELGDDDLLKKQALDRTRAWLQQPRPMDMQLLDSLLQAAASQGGKALAEEYRERMEGTKSGRHTAVLFGALHAFPDLALLEAALDKSIPHGIGLPNLMPVLLRVMATPKLRKVLVDALFRAREALLAAGVSGEGNAGQDKSATSSRGKAAGSDEKTKAQSQKTEVQSQKAKAQSQKTKAERQKNFELVAQLFAVLCNREGIALAKRFAGQEFDPTPFLGAIEGCMAFAAKTQQSATAAFSSPAP